MSADPCQSLREDAVAVWRCGVESVRAERLVQNAVSMSAGELVVCGEQFHVDEIGRIVVVGAGKAGAGMAAGLESVLGEELLRDKVAGWVNVPDDCVRPLSQIRLHPARPAGVNEPTTAGAEGAQRILELVRSVGPSDLCIVLLSGGGSALLPAPVEGVSLGDKQAISRGLSRAGASIEELNCVRKQLSQIKGGRLAAACDCGRMITLIISDVIGDPLDVIASGPTVPDTSTAADALAVVRKYEDRLDSIPDSVVKHLEDSVAQSATQEGAGKAERSDRIRNHVIGNIDVALAAAEDEARRRGYVVQSEGGRNAGLAKEVGRRMADQCLDLQATVRERTCLLSGGEPTVEVVPTEQPRKGGRNQELVLAACQRLWNEDVSRLVLLSGGTDGEDGPTDVAGAWLDADVLQQARQLQQHPEEYLAINNSYAFFEQVGGHLKTGPTHTNVMDLRVSLISPPADADAAPEQTDVSGSSR